MLLINFLFVLLLSSSSTKADLLRKAPNRQPEVPSSYNVVLDCSKVNSAADEGKKIAQQAGGQIGYVYETAIKGFSISDLPDAAIQGIENNP